MADAADACTRTILHACPSPRIVPRLCAVVCKDRSARLRQCCAHYLIQVCLSHAAGGLICTNVSPLMRQIISPKKQGEGPKPYQGWALILNE